MQRHWVGGSMVAALLLLIAICVASLAAQEQGAALPELAPVNSMRSNTAWTFNGVPLMVCQGEWASWNRAHETCQFLSAVPGSTLGAGDVMERVLYDGTRYVRINQDATWIASVDQSYRPEFTINDGFTNITFHAVLSRLGAVMVNNVATTQYQFWSVDEAFNEASGGQAVHDLFVSNDNYVVKTQFSRRGLIDGFGQGELAAVWVFSDFNTPLDVAPPPMEQVQPHDAFVHSGQQFVSNLTLTR
jgi:hypothetical protein